MNNINNKYCWLSVKPPCVTTYDNQSPPISEYTCTCIRNAKIFIVQCAKKVVSDSPGACGFLPDGQVRFFGKFKLQKNCNQSCSSKNFFRQVEMAFGLVHVSYDLPEWQPVKLTFFAPCSEITTVGTSRKEAPLISNWDHIFSLVFILPWLTT